jgi:hypothetical protein
MRLQPRTEELHRIQTLAARKRKRDPSSLRSSECRARTQRLAVRCTGDAAHLGQSGEGFADFVAECGARLHLLPRIAEVRVDEGAGVIEDQMVTPTDQAEEAN